MNEQVIKKLITIPIKELAEKLGISNDDAKAIRSIRIKGDNAEMIVEHQHE